MQWRFGPFRLDQHHACLWQGDTRDEARELLDSIYDWFTEGFDIADLREAKVLLDELA